MYFNFFIDTSNAFSSYINPLRNREAWIYYKTTIQANRRYVDVASFSLYDHHSHQTTALAFCSYTSYVT